LSREVTRDAPGRVNLIGEHTDYNGGFVLPIATPQRTSVALTPAAGQRAAVTSTSIDGSRARQTFTVGGERPTGEWIDYVQGVTVAMRARGLPIGGFEARVSSTVPLGAGLSSSAALEIATVRALAEAFDLAIDPLEAARIGHAAETEFVGAPVGIMDQIAASIATTEAAVFLDARSLEYERVALPASAELIVIDSGIAHSHAGGEYRTRRAECDEAARRLGVALLRDVDVDDLARLSLPDVLARRVRHVVTENARVIAMVEALRAGDVKTAGALMNASHESMRVDFEVSTADIDRLAAIARAHEAVAGARLTGGGFGGAIVAVARSGCAAAAARQIAAEYASEARHKPAVLIPVVLPS
jgi:galactokinase